MPAKKSKPDVIIVNPAFVRDFPAELILQANGSFVASPLKASGGRCAGIWTSVEQHSRPARKSRKAKKTAK